MKKKTTKNGNISATLKKFWNTCTLHRFLYCDILKFVASLSLKEKPLIEKEIIFLLFLTNGQAYFITHF